MIKIVDRQYKVLAILSDTIKPIIKEQINGEYTFRFSTTDQYEFKTEYINENNLLEVDGQLFQISIYEKERTEDNETQVNVYSEQVSYELIDDEHKISSFVQTDKTALEMLQALLQDTNFTIGTVNVPGLTSLEIKQAVTKREVLNSIAKAFGGEFEFDRYTISFLARRGTDKGVRFSIGKNIKGVKRRVDSTKRDSEGNPFIVYEIQVSDLSIFEGLQGLESVSIGDTVKCFDEELGVYVTARIMELERDPELNMTTYISLGNYENIYSSQIEIKKAANLVSSRSSIWERAQAISPEGTVHTDILEGKIKTQQNEVVAGLGSVTITDNNGIMITDQPTIELSSKSIQLLGGLIAISNEKDVNGNFVYRTFGDGDGFTADLITTGILSAERIGAGSITLEKMVSDIGTNIDLSGNPIILSFDEDIRGNYSLIQQQSNLISLKVGYGELISSINLSQEVIKISADKLSLEGLVTVTDLQTAGSTIINGSNIITGYINADRIDGGTISGVTIDVSTDLKVGYNIQLGGSSGLKIENISNDFFYLTRSGSRIMKFFSNGLFAEEVLAIENGGGIGIHNGITGSSWSKLITLYQNNIRIGSSGSAIETDFYYDVDMNNKPIRNVSDLYATNLRSTSGNQLILLSSNSLRIMSTYLGFFSSSGASKQSISDPSSISTYQSADDTYSSNEKDMLNNLRYDVTNVRNTLYNLINALQSYGLV